MGSVSSTSKTSVSEVGYITDCERPDRRVKSVCISFLASRSSDRSTPQKLSCGSSDSMPRMARLTARKAFLLRGFAGVGYERGSLARLFTMSRTVRVASASGLTAQHGKHGLAALAPPNRRVGAGLLGL